MKDYVALLELMNLKLKNVISQLHGVSGRRIIEAIISGDRNPEKLTALCDASILKHKKDRVIASLNGNYKEEHVFMLKQKQDKFLKNVKTGTKKL